MRRRFSGRRLLGAALLIAALAVGARLARQVGGSGALPPTGDNARSLVLVTLDTTRADRLGPYGGPVPTPSLDAVAAAGTVFEHAFAVAPITLVAHTTMMTGLLPPQHGVRNNGTHHAAAELETLAERLRDEGFRTAAFVSAAVLERRYGLDQGFEVYDDDLSAGRERSPRVVPDRPAEATVEAALAWLEATDPEARRFLWVHLYDPHAAYSPPPPYRDQFRDRLYDGEIAYADAQIGRLLAHPSLRRDDVLVAVVGDHGESLGEHGEQTHALLAYDATLRVPLLLAGPGVPRGARVDRGVDQADLLPTLLGRLGLARPAGPGRDLAPAFSGEAIAERPLYAESWLPFYTYGWAKLASVRRGRWKLIEGPDRELYDLARDPRELTDLSREEPGLTHDLGRDLAELRAALGEERESELALDAESVEKLRSLGYLGGGPIAPTDGPRPAPRERVGLHVALERARTHLGDRLWDAAAAELRGVLAKDPGNLAAWMDLADALEGRGDAGGAVAALERALRLDPGSARLLTRLAAVEAGRGRRERALELAALAVARDPRALDARIEQAWLLAGSGDAAGASRALAAAAEIAPADARLEVARARIEDLPRGDLAGAEARLRRALARDPFLVAGWRLLGETLVGAGRPDEAVTAWREGLRRAPDDADLHGRLGELLAARGEPAAEGHLREALRLAPRPSPDLFVALGALLAEEGRTHEALESYDRALALDPDHPAARNNRALALMRTGELAAARRELESLAAATPPHPDAANNLAALAVETADWAAAERWGLRAVELQADAPEPWNNLGLAREHRGRLADAVVAYRRSLDLDPDYWPARFNLAMALAAGGDAEQAVTLLEQVLAERPEQDDARLRLGRLYQDELNRPDAARAHLQAYLRRQPEGPGAAEARSRLDRLSGPGSR